MIYYKTVLGCFAAIIVYCFFFFIVSPVFAQLEGSSWSSINTQVIELGKQAGFSDSSAQRDGGIGVIVEKIISAVLSFLGIIFLVLMIVSGYNWMTAGGDEQKVSKAKDTIRHAVIGLIVVLSAYLITYFVFTLIPFGAAGGGAGPSVVDIEVP